MKTNNQKNKKMIFIIWGVIYFSLCYFSFYNKLLANNVPHTKNEDQKQPNLKSNIDTEQEQQTYNRILNKIEKEVDKLTSQSEQTPSLKYPPKIYYDRDGKTYKKIEEYNQDTGEYNKVIFYLGGKIITYIDEINHDTREYNKVICFNLLNGKKIHHIIKCKQDTMLSKKIINFYDDNQTIHYIEEYNKDKGELFKKTFYNPDGTVRETKLINPNE